jgi:hypothetical protein
MPAYVLESSWGDVQPSADAEWRHKQVELAADDLLQHLDRVSG